LETRRRKHRSGEFAVNITISVPPDVFREIEELTKVLHTNKAELVRKFVLSGLAEYQHNGKPTALPDPKQSS